MAAKITGALGVEVDIAPGNKGQFDVVVDGDVVAGKRNGIYPADDDAIAAVRNKLAL